MGIFSKNDMVNSEQAFTNMSKKGQVSLSNAPTLVITLVVIGIILGLGATVLQKFKDN